MVPKKNSGSEIRNYRLLDIGDFPKNREIAQMAADYLNKLAAELHYDKLGCSYFVNDAPEEFDGQRPSFTIEWRTPKAYAQADQVRHYSVMAQNFIHGAAWALGIKSVDIG